MDAFGTVLIVLAVLAALGAAASYWRSGDMYRDIGRENELLREQPPTGEVTLRDEVRQHVVARNERRMRQGKEPLDVEAEVERQLRDLGA
jgi:uncharacterized protein HemX